MKLKDKYNKLVRKHNRFRIKVSQAVRLINSGLAFNILLGEEMLGITKNYKTKLTWFERKFTNDQTP